jgi:hypothetical protein
MGATDSDGKVELNGVAPGSYRLIAWEEQPPIYAGSLFDPEYLKKYEGLGKSLRVEANRTVEDQVEIILAQ